MSSLQGAKERGSQTHDSSIPDIPRNEATSIPDILRPQEEEMSLGIRLLPFLIFLAICSGPKVPRLLLLCDSSWEGAVPNDNAGSKWEGESHPWTWSSCNELTDKIWSSKGLCVLSNQQLSGTIGMQKELVLECLREQQWGRQGYKWRGFSLPDERGSRPDHSLPPHKQQLYIRSSKWWTGNIYLSHSHHMNSTTYCTVLLTQLTRFQNTMQCTVGRWVCTTI